MAPKSKWCISVQFLANLSYWYQGNPCCHIADES